MEVLVSSTKLILVLRILLVLRSISWSYGTYTGISEHILVFRILYMYYKTYTCLIVTGGPIGTTELN